MAAISLERVEKRFRGGPHVVRGLSLEIPDRAFVTLIGPSGCGKTTALNLIAGLEEPTAGTIRFDGEVVNERSPAERDVAMVFQSYALYPHKTVYENIAFPLRVAGVARAELDRRVREAAARLGLEGLLDRRPRELSGGQRQRVALGRALVRRPRAFLLDEPLSNLDATLRVQMRGELKRLHQELGTTFVYVTHDQAEAMTLSDRVVVFHEGVVQQEGTPREVYERPANLFVARFLGSPPMNVFRRGAHLAGVRAEDARVVVGGAEVAASALKGRVYVVEPMGAETLVTVELESGEKVICRAAAEFAGRAGEPASVVFEETKVHRFEVETGKRVSYRPTGAGEKPPAPSP